MSTVPVIDKFDAVQYTGSNETEVAAVVPQYVFVSESPAGLQFQSVGTWFCPPGGWIVYSTRYLVVLSQWNDTTDFENAYRTLIDGASVVGLQNDVTALQGDVTTLQSDVDDAETDIDALEAAVGTAQTDIGTLQDTLADVAAAISGMVRAAGASTFTFGPGSSTVSVDVQPAQANSSYTAHANLFGGVNLGNLAITAVTPLDANTVNVTVSNSGLLALGASVLVAVTE